MTGENGVVVGKRKYFCTKVVQQLLEIARGQVGASDAAVEKGVAGEYRLVGMKAETKASCSVAPRNSAVSVREIVYKVSLSICPPIWITLSRTIP